jgi:hypothetical protein
MLKYKEKSLGKKKQMKKSRQSMPSLQIDLPEDIHHVIIKCIMETYDSSWDTLASSASVNRLWNSIYHIKDNSTILNLCLNSTNVKLTVQLLYVMTKKEGDISTELLKKCSIQVKTTLFGVLYGNNISRHDYKYWENIIGGEQILINSLSLNIRLYQKQNLIMYSGVATI